MLQAPLGKNKNPLEVARKNLDFPQIQFYREQLRKYLRYQAITAQGSITLTGQPTDGQQFVIGSKTYTFQSVLTNVDGNILIGASLAATQQNIIDAINLTGTPGTQYASAMTEHPQVSAGTAWAANVLVITAKTAGTAGNSLAFTETTSNMTMDGSSVLGGTRAGADESDADSFLFTAHFNNTAAMINAADWADNLFKPLTDQDRRYGSAHINAEYGFTPELMASNATRKISTLDFSRRIKNIRQISPRFYQQKEARGSIPSPFTAHGSNQTYHAIPVDSSRIAILFGQAGGTTGTYLVIATVAADGSLTYGTPVIVDTNQSEVFVDMCLVNTDKILIAYGNAAATNYMTTRVASLSGTTITMNAGVQVAATAVIESRLCKIGTDKALLAWQNGTQTSYNVVTVTGTTPSYGATANLSTTPQYTKLVQNGTDKAQAFYAKSSNCYTVAVSISGTSIGFGVELVMMNGAIINHKRNHDAVQVATDKFVWLGSTFDKSANGDRRNSAFITVSSTTSTVASVSKSSMHSQDRVQILLGADGASYYFTYGNNRDFRGKSFTVDTSGNTMTFPYGNPDLDFDGSDPKEYGFWYSTTHAVVDAMPDVNGNVVQVICGTKTILLYTGIGGYSTYCTNGQTTLGVYVNENLVATLTFNYGFLVEPKSLNTSVLANTAAIKIKNTSSFSILMWVYHTWIELE